MKLRNRLFAPMKFLRFPCIVMALIAFHAHANALFWSEWRTYDVIKDLPYANGKTVEAKSRTRTCLMCAAGPESEEAFFSGEKKYYQKDISISAEALLSQAIPKSRWVSLGKTFTGSDRYFYPIRIFVPSIDPLILIAIPWQYKTDPKSIFASKDIHEEAMKFAEMEHSDNKTPRVRRIAQGWDGDLFIVKEIRGTLPSEASNLRVIIDGFEKDIYVPAQVNETVLLEISTQKIRFTRLTDGRVSMSFSPD